MIRRPRSIRGKLAVITGGAQGIGACIARALASKGATIVLVDIDGALGAETANRIGGNAHAATLDVTDLAAFTKTLDEIERVHGPIDIMINNAGIMRLGLLEDEGEASTLRQIDVNLHATIHGTREAVRRMRIRGMGHVVNVASVAAKVGAAGSATYCATKFGVRGFSEAVRAELRGSGVEISCVMPGIVRTDLTSGLGETRIFRPIQPDVAAAAVVRTLEKPRLEVFTPGYFSLLFWLQGLLPRSLVAYANRLSGLDRVMIAAAHSPEREAYERRATGLEPRSAEAKTLINNADS